MKLGCLIRFKDSAATLPQVLASLAKQSRQVDVLLGVDTGSKDGSAELILAAGGRVVQWTGVYRHPTVLNFGLKELEEVEAVLVLSSHTVLVDGDAVERMVAALEGDAGMCCVSGKWGEDDFSDRITWAELVGKGMRMGSLYSNSMGMLRRWCWVELPFDERLPTAEDYDWCVGQLGRGRVCGRLAFRFNYLRGGGGRAFEFSRTIFRIGKKHGVKVRWLGLRASLVGLLREGSGWLQRKEGAGERLAEIWGRLWGYLL